MNHGYTCASCGSWVFYGSAHLCFGRAYSPPIALTPLPEKKCDHCYCIAVDRNGHVVGKLDHLQCCNCGNKQLKSHVEGSDMVKSGPEAKKDALTSALENPSPKLEKE